MKYKALRFDTIYDLAKFLNAYEIPQQDIVNISLRVSGNGYGVYELLYVEADKGEE